MTYPQLLFISSEELIPISDFKDYLRADDGESDIILRQYINYAIKLLEELAQCSIYHRRYQLDLFPACQDHLNLELPSGPVSQIISVKVNNQLLEPSNYVLQGDTLKLNHTYHKLEIIYETGFTSVTLNTLYKIAILASAADLFIHRFATLQSSALNGHQQIQYYAQILKNYHLN